MKKSMLTLGASGLLAVVLAGLPLSIAAQTKDSSATGTQPAATDKKAAPPTRDRGEKKQRPIPFHGKLTAVDKTGKTITVGERVFQITSDTKIFTADKKPATLDAGVVEENVTGSYKKTEDGKLLANSVYFGAKGEGKSADKKESGKKEGEDKGTKKKSEK